MQHSGLQLDTDMEAIVVQDDFGLSDAFSDPNKELWLLRVPLDVSDRIAVLVMMCVVTAFEGFREIHAVPREKRDYMDSDPLQEDGN